MLHHHRLRIWTSSSPGGRRALAVCRSIVSRCIPGAHSQRTPTRACLPVLSQTIATLLRCFSGRKYLGVSDRDADKPALRREGQHFSGGSRRQGRDSATTGCVRPPAPVPRVLRGYESLQGVMTAVWWPVVSLVWIKRVRPFVHRFQPKRTTGKTRCIQRRKPCSKCLPSSREVRVVCVCVQS